MRMTRSLLPYVLAAALLTAGCSGGGDDGGGGGTAQASTGGGAPVGGNEDDGGGGGIGPPGRLHFASATEFMIDEFQSAAVAAVVRSEGSTGTISATVTMTDGTATAGEDYVPTTVTLTFEDGDWGPQFVEIPVVDDDEVEGDETINLFLTGTIREPSSAILTILDDDDDR